MSRQDERNEKLAIETAMFRDIIDEKLAPGGHLIDNELTITINTEQKEGKHGIREREFTVTFTGEAAKKFVANPTMRAILRQKGWKESLIDEMESGTYALVLMSIG